MMNILFDLIATQPQGSTIFHGGAEYTKCIFLKFIELNEKHRIFAVFDATRNYDVELIKICNKYNVPCFFIKNKQQLEEIVVNEKIDTLFVGIYHEYFECISPENVRILFTCHDLRELEIEYDYTFRYYFDYNNVKEYIKVCLKLFFKSSYKKYLQKKYKVKMGNLIQRSQKVITDSLYSKYSIMSHFPNIAVEKLQVIYCPYKSHSFTETIDMGLQNKKYFLLISTNRYEKNSFRAIKALDNLISNGKLEDYTVICTGNIPSQIKAMIRNIDKFSFYGYVSENQLQNLYKNAYAFIFPTLGEGFGYPPLEAMKYGTLVLAASVTSVPEVCGNAALYFNPYSISEIENRILYAITEDISQYKQRAINRFQLFKAIQEQSLMNIIELINENHNEIK